MEENEVFEHEDHKNICEIFLRYIKEYGKYNFFREKFKEETNIINKMLSSLLEINNFKNVNRTFFSVTKSYTPINYLTASLSPKRCGMVKENKDWVKLVMVHTNIQHSFEKKHRDYTLE